MASGEEAKQKCFFCSSEAAEACQRCNRMRFCSRHRALHEVGPDACAKFAVLRNGGDSWGARLVASENIEAGELLLREDPCVVCPNIKSLPVCLNCLKAVADDSRCAKCSAPLCCSLEENARQRGEGCATLRRHDEEECAALAVAFSTAKGASLKQSLSKRLQPCPLYSCIGPLRLLMHHQRDPEAFEDVLGRLLDHSDLRRAKDPRGFALSHALLNGVLRGACRLDFKGDLERLSGLLRINGVKLDGVPAGIGLYPTFSLLNHSCLPNTRTKKLPGTRDVISHSAIY